jgi:hypothetical protein
MIPRGTSCDDPGYATIQSAVNAALPGDTINVCPGTYPEQVTISGALKNNLTLRSTVYREAMILAPAVLLDPGDIVRINGAQNVTLLDFTISGPFPDLLFCSTFTRSGVRVDGGGSATIKGNRITEIRAVTQALFGGCQNGVGILVGRNAEMQTGSATVYGNLVDNYQKGGIVVDSNGSSANITWNTFQGVGPTNLIAQNGIQVSRGATAQVHHNITADHTYSLAPLAGGAGIILFSAGATTATYNVSERNDDNLSAYSMGGAYVKFNRLSDSTFFDGIFMASDTSGMRVHGNIALGNGEHDCHDDSAGGGTAGTANLWTDNTGITQTPAGICFEDDDDYDDDGKDCDRDEDDDNDGHHDDVDGDDDNDGYHDDVDADDDNDGISDAVDRLTTFATPLLPGGTGVTLPRPAPSVVR